MVDGVDSNARRLTRHSLCHLLHSTQPVTWSVYWQTKQHTDIIQI